MHCVAIYVFSALILQIKTYEIKVKVKQGTLVGTSAVTLFDRRLYYAFYGVPYARPPVRKLRFKDPKPLKKWKYTFDARTEYHGACAQLHIIHKHAQYGVEDCLHLNIYTPSLSKDRTGSYRAVLVWVHGYGFTSGFSHIHGADFLIDNDVIFISVTHRLGVFGFLKVNDTDSNANMGLKDIVMALKWIKKNIKQFGGDKNKITVMGSGSAGTFVSLLLLTKQRKLFSQMILQSGAIFSPSIFQNDYKLERVRLLEQLKKVAVKDLKKASAKNILIASQKIYSNMEVINIQKSVVQFSPIIEKESSEALVVKKPEEFYNNVHKDMLNMNMPMLIGFNSQESISEVLPFIHNPRYLNSLKPFFKFMVPFMDGCNYNFSSTTYQEIAEKIEKKYFKKGISENSIEDFLRYVSDLHKFPIYKFIKTHVNIVKSKMYVYKFNYVGKLNAVRHTALAGVDMKVKGAATGDEICYILKCEPLWEQYVKVNDDINNRDRQFIKEMAEMWSNFAKFGNPSAHKSVANVTWLPMTSLEDNILHIGRTNKLIHSKLENKMFSFWNELHDTYYSYEHCDKNKHDEL